LVVGEGSRVQIVNRTLERTFGPLAGRLDELLAGDVLHCHEAMQGSGACGALESCEACQVSRVVREALAGHEIHRRRAEFHIGENGSSRSLVLLITAAPLEYEGSRGALVILEDATELNGLRALIGGEKSFSGIIGHDRAMQEVYEAIREVAEVTSPVLIQGESGTGKELVARAIHREGPRAAQAFIAVNCGAIPETLLESELFGHVKGAFTGAIRDKKGRFELADGGTIFLDEVADLSPAMQVKLMRVLQERTFERVGGERTLSVDVRVISASNRDLRKEIAAGKFREDLYYRLCVIPIHLPPLRERAVDVPLLAEYILERIATLGGRPKASIGPGAMALLMEHPWPGNVRELQNVLEFALVKSRGEVIEAAHLPAELRTQGRERPTVNWRRRQVTAADLERALAEADGNKVRAASLLGISRATLYRLLNQGSDPSGT
ncbi:MAG TPA: sigma 54-interacting transcriptional regulator, partial [Thermoanaerobaculaceae bacterium]|nr:sigma 54-interacting transcriptional regulator [Thermoanaerobaculaceae bacterium]